MLCFVYKPRKTYLINFNERKDFIDMKVGDFIR